MSRNRIVLDDESKLKIFMFPLRQKIIKELSYKGTPATAKQLADSLGITPSSAKHHLDKLSSVGIVEFDHHEFIHGIRANYYRLTGAIISIGQNGADGSCPERDAFILKELSDASSNYQAVLGSLRERPPAYPAADLYSGIAHLEDEQIKELMQMIDDFMEKHAYAGNSSGRVTHPWEFVLVGYRKDIAKEITGR